MAGQGSPEEPYLAENAERPPWWNHACGFGRRVPTGESFTCRWRRATLVEALHGDEQAVEADGNADLINRAQSWKRWILLGQPLIEEFR